MLSVPVIANTTANEQLWSAVYERLRALAQAAASGNANHTLQPAAVVHEVFLELENHLDRLQDRRHFLRTAARAMRQVLINYANAARAQKRDGPRVELTTLSGQSAAQTEASDALALKESLDELEQLNDRQARVVELPFLCAFAIDQTADALAISHGTLESDWAMGQAWLQRRLESA